MPLYYITGLPGSGKSSVLAELRHRSLAAYDIDDLAAFYDVRTGQEVDGGYTASERTPEWRKYRQWKIKPERIEALATEATYQPVFLCGVVGNDIEFWDKFTKVFCLYVPARELKHRLIGRSDDNAYGKNVHELATALKWAADSRRQYADLGAIIVDATRPVKKVADDILSYIRKTESEK